MVHAQKSACTDMRSSYTNRHKQILSLNKMFCNGTERETQREGLLKQERCFFFVFFSGAVAAEAETEAEVVAFLTNLPVHLLYI